MNTMTSQRLARVGSRQLLPLLVLAAALVGCGSSEQPTAGLACELQSPVSAPGVATEVPCSERSDPNVQAMSDEGIGLTSELGLPAGRYTLPASPAPTQLVVMFHGHGNDSCSWRNHLRQVAERGAIAVAMNYTGQTDKEVESFGFVENYGWFARAGAADSIAAARYFLEHYPSIEKVFNFAVSMGGNMGGVAAASTDAVRADCSPLWDYWVALEGVHNLTEEYTGARTLAPTSEPARLAVREIEEENGGTLEEVPERYAEITNVDRAPDMDELKGVVLVHGTNDQTVPFDQSRQMKDALTAVQVPAHVYFIEGQDHNWEGSDTEPVVVRGFEELYKLMDGGTVEPGETFE